MSTSEIGAVRQTSSHFAGLGDDVDDALLDEVHLGADRALSDDVVARLEHLVLQLSDHLRHEVGVGVREERHRRHQSAAVEIDYFLSREKQHRSVAFKCNQTSDVLDLVLIVYAAAKAS